MAHSPFILSELEYGRFLELLRRSDRGHVPASASVADLLRKTLFPCGVEYLAALAPLTRLGGGLFSLAGSSAACCWPLGAEKTADTRFAPGEVRVEGLTGTWEDGNGRQCAIAWGEAVAGRVWRRPGDPCSPQTAIERLLCLIALAILFERMAARGYDAEPVPSLPVVDPSPPLAPDLPVMDCDDAAPPSAEPPGVGANDAAGSSEPSDNRDLGGLYAEAAQAAARAAEALAEAARDPHWLAAMDARGVRVDQLKDMAALAHRLKADAAHFATRGAEIAALRSVFEDRSPDRS